MDFTSQKLYGIHLTTLLIAFVHREELGSRISTAMHESVDQELLCDIEVHTREAKVCLTDKQMRALLRYEG